MNLLLTLAITAACLFSTALAQIQYEGCYLDTPDRDFDLELTSTDLQQPISPEICATACQARGYTVIGLQWGDSCWCGNSFGKHGLSQLWPCDEPCPGDCSQTCGGPWTNDVYTITSGPSSLAYKGCFIDTPESDLDIQLTEQDLGEPNSPEVCAAACSSRGYTVIGLQWGDSCWCGHSHGKYGLSQLWPCDEPCPGDCSKTCGGPWTNDIYTISTDAKLAESTSQQYQYIGCWNSTAGEHFDSYSMAGSLTPSSCATECQGSRYMGLKTGRICLCGDQRLDDVRVPEVTCSRYCEGDDEQVCGGVAQISVFALTS